MKKGEDAVVTSAHTLFWACIAGALIALGLMADGAQASQIPDCDAKLDVVYGSAGGEKLCLDLYLPRGINEPAPLAVWVHGGGWVGGSRSQLGPGADELVKRGFAVASLDYRLGPAHPWPAQIDDVRSALCFLCNSAARFNIDPGRTCLWGGSAGGQLVSLLGLTGNYEQEPLRIRAVVDFCGPADLLASDFPEALAHMLEAVFPPGENQRELMREASPVRHVTAGAPPFLIIHGEYDNLVPPAQARLFHTRLKEAGAPSELVIVRNAGHGFQAMNGEPGYTRVQMGHMVVEFFEKNLKPEKCSAPVKASPSKETPIPGGSERP